MNITRKIGKITSAKFGFGGYQDAMIGFSVEFESEKDSWGVGDFKGAWNMSIEPGKWTESDRSKQLADTVRLIDDTLSKAKVRTIDELVGIPVEVAFSDNRLESWRVLEEAI